MTKNSLFEILNFGYWKLFVIWCLPCTMLGAGLGISSFTYLSIAVDDKFRGRQLLEPHGAEGMEFGRADSDFRTQSQLESVAEPGGGIDQNTRRIHLSQEPLGVLIVRSENRLGMEGAISSNVLHRFLNPFPHTDGENEIEIFLKPILLGGLFDPGEDLSCSRASAKLYPFLLKGLCDPGKKRLGNLPMAKKGFQGFNTPG